MQLIVQEVINGIVNGSVYALIAMGITLIFGLTGIINFAHGEFMMLGAYVTLVIAAQGGWAFAAAIALAALGVGALGAGLEKTVFAPTVSRPMNGFVVSLGLAAVLQNVVALKYGTVPRVLTSPLQGTITAGGFYLPTMRAVVLAIALALTAAFFYFLTRTRRGIALRSCSADPEVATMMGINVPSMQLLAFVVGSALAGGGGALLATSYPFTPFFGSSVVVKGFVVALVGGLGNVMGAFRIAIVFGIAEALVVGAGLGAWTDALMSLVIVAVLLVRPMGLMRGTEGPSVV